MSNSPTKQVNTFKALALISLLPFAFALFLAAYAWFDLANYTGIHWPFARINSYIYAHSFGVILLVLLTGIQMGIIITQSNQRFYLLLSFVLILVAWFSFKTYADFTGIIIMMICYGASWLSDSMIKPLAVIPQWYSALKNRLYVVILLLLAMLCAINQ